MTSEDFEYVTDNIEGGPVFRDIGKIVTSVITLLQLSSGFVFYTGKNSSKIRLVTLKKSARAISALCWTKIDQAVKLNRN